MTRFSQYFRPFATLTPIILTIFLLLPILLLPTGCEDDGVTFSPLTDIDVETETDAPGDYDQADVTDIPEDSDSTDSDNDTDSLDQTDIEGTDSDNEGADSDRIEVDPNDPCGREIFNHPNPCTELNKTVCIPDGETYTCRCEPGYVENSSGNCSLTNPCEIDQTCYDDHHLCLIQGGEATCGDCLYGYHEENDECVPDVHPDGNPIWSDAGTGLDWQAVPPESEMTWDWAVNYCDGLDLGGFTDWRLPNITELRTLLRDCWTVSAYSDACPVHDVCSHCGPFPFDACLEVECKIMEFCGKCRNGSAFPEDLPGADDGYWWSSSETSWGGNNTSAWELNYQGTIGHNNKLSSSTKIRCVRGPN